jgi:hypothetical protein
VKGKRQPTECKGAGNIELGRLQVHLDRREDVTAYGGLGLVTQAARKLGFFDSVDRRVKVLEIHQGYRESDHLFHLLCSIFAGAGRLQDTALFQADPTYRKLLRVERVSDPTTLGDFLRRFGRSDLNELKEAGWEMQSKAWRELSRRQRRLASLDLDSRICQVYGDSKEGADYSYKKTLAYHPEMLSLGETGEWLDGVNRSGNEPSGERAAYLLRRNLPRVKELFQSVCVRGDTKFGRTDVLDVCRAEEVRVCVCWAGYPNLISTAEALPEYRWRVLCRRPSAAGPEKTRRKRPNLRRRNARQRGYTDKKLKSEQVAEFAYCPSRQKQPKTYRMIAVRKQIEVAGKKMALFDQYEYRFILTDLAETSLERIVRYAYGRCNQENLIEQGKNGVSAFRMPTGELQANEAWMLVAMLAHNLKNWICLLALGKEKLSWEWKKFRLCFVYVVARVTHAARQVHLWLSPGHPFTPEILAGARLLGAAGA